MKVFAVLLVLVLAVPLLAQTNQHLFPDWFLITQHVFARPNWSFYHATDLWQAQVDLAKMREDNYRRFDLALAKIRAANPFYFDEVMKENGLEMGE